MSENRRPGGDHSAIDAFRQRLEERRRRLRPSGEHPAVDAFRKKLDSMAGALPVVEILNERIRTFKKVIEESDEEVPTSPLASEPAPVSSSGR